MTYDISALDPMCFPRDPALKIWSQTIWNCHQKTGVFCKSQRGREKTPLLTNLLGEATCGVSSLLLKKALKKKKKKESLSVHSGAWPSCQVVCPSLGRIRTHRALGCPCGNQLPSSLSLPACKHNRHGLQAQGLAATGNL